MASFLDKFKLAVAAPAKYNEMDLSCDHITSANWMELMPIYAKEMVPKEKININIETYTRMEPLVKPTFGRGNINNRAFFVPFRTVWEAWNDFITATPHVTDSNHTPSIINSVPIVSNWNIRALFTSNTDYATTAVTTTPATALGDYIFTSINSGGTTNHYVVNLTAKGRKAMKILNALGYTVEWYLDARETQTEQAGRVFSALPMLAFAKAYIDWYYPSAYMVNDAVGDITMLFKKQTYYSLTYQDLKKIFDMVTNVNYDSDYFVSAWQNPTTPNNGIGAASTPEITINDISNGTSETARQVTSTTSNAGTTNPKGGTPYTNGGRLTQYTVDALKKLTDYLKRHQLAGARTLDKYLARFGVQLSAEKLNRCNFLGSDIVPLQIGDVVSTSSTNGASLGDFAGKGIAYGKPNSFECETDEYGMLFIMSSIVPKVGYYQGIDKNLTHITRLDYWTPEFDQLGTQAISSDELFIPNSGATNIIHPNSYIFGFTPRYSEYKIGHDRVTGNLRFSYLNSGTPSTFPSKSAGGAWTLMREFDPTNWTSSANMVQNFDFVTGKDAEQYNRIFQHYVSTSAFNKDQFNVIYHFDVKSYSPMKKLFDTYEFEHDHDTQYVTEDVNGVKMN